MLPDEDDDDNDEEDEDDEHGEVEDVGALVVAKIEVNCI